MTNVYGVSFNKNSKVYYFKTELKCRIDVTVIVETEKGEQFGKIVSEITDKNKANKFSDLKKIIRISTKDDYKEHLRNIKDAEKALKKCREIAAELNLDMNFISANYSFSRSQLVFNFYADERVDFRELAKKLAMLYKTRIELRQVGARDKAREVSGEGVCGQKLCCSRFLNQMESVSISMAKNQNLALNPSKINGACNRLLCCLAYEDDNYTEIRKELPNIGSSIKCGNKNGTVRSLNILKNSYIVDVNGERIEVSNNENSKK